MVHIAVFHHARGLSAGVVSFAEQLRADGHDVTVPDLYDGATFDSLAEGMAHAERIGFGSIVERGSDAVAGLPYETVYVGFSLGVLPAQMSAQTRPGAKGAVLCHACVPPSEFGAGWPSGVPVQIHAMDRDDLFVSGGDLDAARGVVKATGDATLFLYPGDRHLFADSSLPDHERAAADLLLQRVRGFLADRA